MWVQLPQSLFEIVGVTVLYQPSKLALAGSIPVYLLTPRLTAGHKTLDLVI